MAFEDRGFTLEVRLGDRDDQRELATARSIVRSSDGGQAGRDDPTPGPSDHDEASGAKGESP